MTTLARVAIVVLRAGPPELVRCRAAFIRIETCATRVLCLSTRRLTSREHQTQRE
jgi:hypothetical protein